MIDAVDLLVIYKSIITDVKTKIEDLELDLSERQMLTKIDLIYFADVKKQIHYLGEMVDIKFKKMAEKDNEGT